MGTPPIRVLGRIVVDDPAADRALGRGQARELLGYLVARRHRPATTDDVVGALWGDEPPATAPTIVHGLVRRLRAALGTESVIHDPRGYLLGPDVHDVDLWTVQDLIEAGALADARAQWREPVFGPYAERAWARTASEVTRPVIEPDHDVLLRTRRHVPVRRLIGRRRELATVEAGLRRSRVVTLVGLGGVGKTRLGLEVARGADRRVTHIDVSAAVGPIACRVATELGQATSGDALTDLRGAASLIGQDRRLLLIDGCDQDLAGTATVVEHLVGACPQLSVLATSRVALGIPGEQIVPLLPFADPEDLRGDAVELLLDRVRSMGWEPEPADRATAAEISRRAAGVPLAIELGAIELLVPARPRHDDRAAAATSPDAAVSAAVECAIAQLSDATRTTAARGARLVAGFTTDLVPELAPEGSSSAAVLQELVTGGLVAIETSGASRRIRFLDRVRAALLAASDGDPTADQVVTRAVLDILRAVRPDLVAPRVVPALGRAIDELANVDGLLDRMEATHHPADRLALSIAAAETWAEDGHWTSGPRHIESALHACGDIDPVARARAVRAWTVALGTYDGARRLLPELHRAADAAAAADEPVLEGHLRLQLANAHGYAGQMPEAALAFARLQELARTLDSEYVEIAVRSLEGVGRMMTGDNEGARRTLDAIATRLEALGALSDAARMHRMSSLASRAVGDLGVALDALLAAERLAEAGLARGTLATVRTDLAEVRLSVGDPAAGACLEAALDAALAVGNLRAAGLVRARLGMLEHDAPTLARGTLDLWFADRRRAAPALVQLAGLLASDDELQAAVTWAVPAMVAGWGTPLDVEAQALVAPHLGGADAPPADWEARLQGLLDRATPTI